MKKSLHPSVLCFLFLLASCNVFAPVDPIGPTVSTGLVTDLQPTTLKITGTLSDPSYKNQRQKKKSGNVIEYGFVYGIADDPGAAKVVKVGDAVTVFPFDFNATITGLSSNTTYKVWAYAKNEGGLITYGNESGKKTNDFPDPNPTINYLATDSYRAPAQINFTTTDNTPGATYKWDFGDGTTATTKNPSKVYTSGGTFSVKLIISANGKVKENTKPMYIDAAYTKVTITRITLQSYLEIRENGSAWDNAGTGNAYVTGGPDMHIKALVSGQSSWAFYTFPYKVNVTPAQVNSGSIFWYTPLTTGGLSPKTFSGSEMNAPIDIQLLDSENGMYSWMLQDIFLEAPMGYVTFKWSEYMVLTKKYPTKITLQGTGTRLNSMLKLEIQVQWSL